MTNTNPAPDKDLDMIREVAHIGMGKAATALSKMMGKPVTLDVPKAQALPFGEVADAMGGPETPVTALHFRVTGDVHGNILVVLPVMSSLSLLQQSLGPSEDRDLFNLDVIAKSALMEVGNILASAYVGAVGTLVNKALMITIPGLSVDMAGAVVDTLLSEIAMSADEAQVVETCFASKDLGIRGSTYFLAMPDTAPAMKKFLGLG